MAKAKKTTPRRKSSRAVEEAHVGMEFTDWENVDNFPNSRQVELKRDTLRNYGYFYDSKDAVKWALAWMPKKGYTPAKIKHFKAANARFFSHTAGSLCKMASNGYKFTESDERLVTGQIDMHILRGKQANKSKKNEPTKYVKTPAEALKEKTSDIIADIEGVVDEYDHTNHKEHMKWSVLGVFERMEASYQSAKAVRDYYEPLANELMELYSKKTEDLVEAYGWLGVHGRKRYLDFVSKIVSDCDDYMESKKKVRKPRKKKVKTPEAQTSKVKYLDKFDELGMVSSNPEKIVGANTLYLFNTKYRKLTKLISDSVKGFEVKGTTVQNLDLDSCMTKIIRKPEEFFSDAEKTTKPRLAKKLKELKTKESVSTGRINADTIIWKVYK